jgi:hypothetical protein
MPPIPQRVVSVNGNTEQTILAEKTKTNGDIAWQTATCCALGRGLTRLLIEKRSKIIDVKRKPRRLDGSGPVYVIYAGASRQKFASITAM